MKATFALGFGVLLLVACQARVRVDEPREECRTVEVRGRHDVEVCHSRCNDETCRTRCREHERVSRERRCWVD